MKNLSDLPSVSRILFKGGVEILRFKYARPWPDEPGLNVMLQQNLQRLAVAFKHGEQEERQHNDNHERRRHAHANGSLCQEEHRQTNQCAQTEADNLPLGQVEQKLGFDAGQILRNRYISHRLSSFSAKHVPDRKPFPGLTPASLTPGLPLAQRPVLLSWFCFPACVFLFHCRHVRS